MAKDAAGDQELVQRQNEGNRNGNEERRGNPHVDAVSALFGLGAINQGPFPSNFFTVPDQTQNTCVRMNLPMPMCDAPANTPSDCSEIALVNNLDGFNLTPRAGIPFSGPVDLSTVNSSTIFFVKLGDALVNGAPDCLLPAPAPQGGDDDASVPAPDAGWIVGINQAVWDPDTNTLFVEADEILDEHTHYALVVTHGVLDLDGNPVETTKAFKQAIGLDDAGDADQAIADPAMLAYDSALSIAVHQLHSFGIRHHDIASASIFTTLSATSTLEKIRDQVALTATPPAPADFNIGPGGSRAVFSLGEIASMTFNRQQSVTGALSPLSLAPRLATLRGIPGVAKLAWGRYQSPQYLSTDRVIPPVGTYSGVPAVQRTETVYFNVVLPAGSMPANGWPVIFYGQGTGDNLNAAPFNVAADFASHGFATVAINFPGQGLGPNSTVTVARTGQTAFTFPEGGRAVDVNGDGRFASPEGWDAFGANTILLSRHASTQAAVDFMQLINEIQLGMDVDGDGIIDLDASHIYFAGLSAGSAVGAVLTALDARVRATVMSGVSGWPSPHISPPARATVGAFLASHVPTLINPPGAPVLTSLGGVSVAAPFFNENAPARDQSPLVNTVPGALALQEFLERLEWLSQTGAAGAYSVHWRRKPLAGVSVRPVLIQMSRGDQQAVNPVTAAMTRAGLIADRVSLYRHDLFVNRDQFKDPHSLVIRTDTPVMHDLAVLAQDQISAFCASDGATTIDPDGGGVLFEVPPATVPEDFGFIP